MVSGTLLISDSTSPSDDEIQTYAYMSIKTDQVLLSWYARGDVAVQDLEIGDRVLTASGQQRPIRWIGHRAIDCSGHPGSQDALPVRIATHAFGKHRPARDLMLSPGHTVLVGADAEGAGGHLVPIMCLINGTTIERVAVDSVIYWHVELDEHDILSAEGLAAESYIDLGSRPWFAGANGSLYDPDIALPGMPGRCRPVAMGLPSKPNGAGSTLCSQAS